MKSLLAGLLLYTAFAAEGHAQPEGPAIDVAAALERIRDTGIFPEYLSPEYSDLHRAVNEIVKRDPQGYVAELAGRVLTQVAVRLEHPLMSSNQWLGLTANLSGMTGLGHAHRAKIFGSLDGGGWVPVAEIEKDVGLMIPCDVLGPTACAPGWHSLAVRAELSAWEGQSQEPVWVETRDLPTQAYGVYRPSDLHGQAGQFNHVATPATWMRTVLEAPASLIDSQLPPVPLQVWLASTLRAVGQADLTQRIAWESGPCGRDPYQRFTDLSRAAVCIIARGGTYEPWGLHLEFSLGPLMNETGLKRGPEMPAFYQGCLEDQRGALDLSKLSELASTFQKPRKTWPVAELRVSPTDILYSPLVPNPGDTVTVEFTVHNDGQQDARALIEFWLNDGLEQVEQEDLVRLIADVPAGRFYRFRRSIRLPLGSGTGGAGLKAQLAPPRGSIMPVGEANYNNNDAVRLLGALRIIGVPD